MLSCLGAQLVSLITVNIQAYARGFFCSTFSEIDDERKVLKWDFCLEDCPSDDPIIACTDAPMYPEFLDENESFHKNFSTKYILGEYQPIVELDYVAFECPKGFSVEGSNDTAVYSFCHNWTYLYSYNETSKCSRKGYF